MIFEIDKIRNSNLKTQENLTSLRSSPNKMRRSSNFEKLKTGFFDNTNLKSPIWKTFFKNHVAFYFKLYRPQVIMMWI